MDKMSFSLDYDCYYYPRFLDREVCANGVDPDDRIIWYPRFVFETIVFRVMFEKVCTEQFF